MAKDKYTGFSDSAVPQSWRRGLLDSAKFSEDPDISLRLKAFEHVRRLADTYGQFSSAQLAPGFEYAGQRIPLINPQRGIFKPKQMTYLLSIRTVFPRPGRRVWYDDQRDVHRQIFEGEETVEYAFMGDNPEAADNRWLRDAMVNRIPIIYFLGVSPGLYQSMVPTFIVDWDERSLKAHVAFGDIERRSVSDVYVVPPETSIERRYTLRTVKQRLHQATFREAVIDAYGRRCALSNLPESLLLDAAHIISDGDEHLGQPVVTNGIPLSKIHHAAFDAHLIGIDPNYKIHVSERLLAQNDGPMLQSLKDLKGASLRPPNREKDYPDRERLAVRFNEYCARL